MKHLSIFLIFLFLIVNLSSAQFKYENPIWIKNNTGTALTDVQVLIVVNTLTPISAGWMQANGNDIRFVTTCNSTIYLGHWVEGYLNTDTTAIWVNVPSIGANDSTEIYMYYGNSTATNISTISVFYGPHSSTDSVVVTSTNTISNCQRGFRFTANEDVLVAYFGKRIPNATQRYLTLFDFTTQAILAQIQVDGGTSGVYNYNSLTSPLWLKSGQQYVMELFNGTGDMYYYGLSSQMGQHLTYGAMMYCNNCTQNTFPTTILTTQQHYGCPDFLYYTKQNVSPAPTYSVLPPTDTVTPAIPTGLSASGTNLSAILQWSKNTEFDIAQYSIYQNTTNNPVTATFKGTVIHPDTTYYATGLTNGTSYYFWIKAEDGYCVPRVSDFSTVATCIPVGITKIDNNIPNNYYLSQNYPNPFNPITKIKYGLKKQSNVSLDIYDALGRLVKTLIKSNQPAGNYEIDFNGQEFASGIYFCKLVSADFTALKKMVLIK
ncbi:MAG: DUF2341 domain-containing protein [Ignavibacteria bacterium]|jgi:hypothetical protein